MVHPSEDRAGAATGIIACGFAVLALMVGGTLLAYWKAPFSFDPGDNALFHAFGHWIAQGEVFIRDFIHFRTPGPYYYYALMQSVFGDSFRVTSFALLLEAHVAQSVASFYLGAALTRVLTGRVSLPIAIACGAVFLFLPPIFQIRTALPCMALATYILADRPGATRSWTTLLVAGILLGASYWFGQELFLFLGFCIALTELTFHSGNWRKLAGRATMLAAGMALAIVPGLLYLWLAGADLSEFFYYIFQYAFTIQPQGMDIPFPSWSRATVSFYLPFLVIVVAYAMAVLAGVIRNPAVFALLCFASVRMVSALGRADFLHVLFSSSEVVVLLCCGGLLLSRVRLTGKRVLAAVLLAGVVALIFSWGMHGKSSVLLAIPLITTAAAVIAGRRRADGDSSVPVVASSAMATAGIALLAFGLALGAFYPHSFTAFWGGLQAASKEVVKPVKGVELPPGAFEEIQEVQRLLDEHGADMVYTYPIRSEFYGLVPRHGARLATLEPQTTPDELRRTIQELESSFPPVIVRDLEQMAFLSHKLAPLSDWINTHYRVEKLVLGAHRLELLERRAAPQPMARLFDRAYELNSDRGALPLGERRIDDGRVLPVVEVVKGSGRFELDVPGPAVFRTRLNAQSDASDTGVVELRRGDWRRSLPIAAAQGWVTVSVPENPAAIEITLRSASPERRVVWVNPEVIAVKANDASAAIAGGRWPGD